MQNNKKFGIIKLRPVHQGREGRGGGAYGPERRHQLSAARGAEEERGRHGKGRDGARAVYGFGGEAAPTLARSLARCGSVGGESREATLAEECSRTSNGPGRGGQRVWPEATLALLVLLSILGKKGERFIVLKKLGESFITICIN